MRVVLLLLLVAACDASGHRDATETTAALGDICEGAASEYSVPNTNPTCVSGIEVWCVCRTRDVSVGYCPDEKFSDFYREQWALWCPRAAPVAEGRSGGY